MKNFEENLTHLEQLTQTIKRSDISLEDALKAFEEGITLAKKMEKEIEKIEGKIQILMNQPEPSSGKAGEEPSAPEFDLFSAVDSTGSAGSPTEGVRQNG